MSRCGSLGMTWVFVGACKERECIQTAKDERDLEGDETLHPERYRVID